VSKRAPTRPVAVGWALVRACHPEPTLAVTAVITTLAATTGRGLAGVVAVAAAVLSGQLVTGWSNDYLDAERDAASGRQDKPVATGELSKRVVLVATVAAAVACVPLSLLSGWRAGMLHLVAVACAVGYNAGLKSTVLSPLPYAVAFGIAPAFVVLGLPGAPTPPHWLVAAGALLGAGAHFANVLPDLADDDATGVRGLPHRLGYRASAGCAAVLLGAVAVVIAFGPPGPPRPAGLAAVGATVVVLGVGLWLGRRAGSRAVFRAVLVVAVIDLALLLVSGVEVR
jgi:protoheme IX farnesyltransferase